MILKGFQNLFCSSRVVHGKIRLKVSMMLATSHTATDVNHPDTALYTRAVINLKIAALLLGKKQCTDLNRKFTAFLHKT